MLKSFLLDYLLFFKNHLQSSQLKKPRSKAISLLFFFPPHQPFSHIFVDLHFTFFNVFVFVFCFFCALRLFNVPFNSVPP